MTYILSFRSSPDKGASVEDARGYQTIDINSPPGVKPFDVARMGALSAGLHVLFSVHGFNVPFRRGYVSATRQELDLRKKDAPFQLGADSMFVGVLWPGDWWVPIVNYSFEAEDALLSGKYLAHTINTHFKNAASISLASHSLGSRVILNAATHLNRRVRELVLTAAAADNDCLARQHAAAHANAERVCVLSSKRDKTLRWAYPVGDAVSDILGDGDSVFGGALGYRGPRPAVMDRMSAFAIAGKPRNGKRPSKISDYDHTDYYPSASDPRPADRKSDTVSSYLAAAFRAQPTYWR